MSNLQINTPRWALPLLRPVRYKGAKGGRGSGKSHERAEALIESIILDENKQIVCIREIQKSLKFSAKKLIESKISDMGLSHMFDCTLTEIRRIGGAGLIIFQGMQDHTADSIKSLEGFDIAWVEEAQNLSSRSLELLRPTIRKPDSEIWFTWNPDQDTDAVDSFFLEGVENDPDSFALVHVNFDENPFLPDVLYQEMLYDRKHNQESFGHVWLGEYNTKTEAQVFKNKFVLEDFSPEKSWDGPYFGLDFGFAQDPTAGTKLWIHKNTLYIEYEAGQVELELDDTATFLKDRLPDVARHVVRADSARPESISYLKRHGLSRITGVEKGKGSVEDGVEFIKSFAKVVIHTRCQSVAQEFRLYSYKIDKRSGDILPVLEDRNNHYIDSIRYALEPIMKNKGNSLERFKALT